MRLLPKSRFSSTEEPPAEEPNKAADNSDHSDRDPRYGARGKPALVGATAILYEVAENRALIIRWRSAASAVGDAGDGAISGIRRARHTGVLILVVPSAANVAI